MKRDIEWEVYQRMCAGCEREHYCHNNCENCEEYADAVEEEYEKEENYGKE